MTGQGHARETGANFPNRNGRSRVVPAVVCFLLALYLWGFRGTSHSTDEWLFIDEMTRMLREGPEAVPAEYWTYYGLGIPLILLSQAVETIGTYQALTLINVFATAITGGILTALLQALGYDAKVAAAVAVAYAASTRAFPYSGYLLREPAAGMWLLLALWLAIRYRQGGGFPSFVGAVAAFVAATLTKGSISAIFPLLALYLAYALYGRTKPANALWVGMNRSSQYALIALVMGVFVLVGWMLFSFLPYRLIRVSTVPTALLGLFVSPGWGALLFNPVLLIGVAGMPLFVRRHRAEGMLLVGVAVAYAVGVATDRYWWGLWHWGPRQLNPVLALWVLPAAAAIVTWGNRRAFKMAFGATVIAGAVVNAMQSLVPYPLYQAVLWAGISDWDFVWTLKTSPLVNHWRFFSLENAEVVWAGPDGVRWPLFLMLSVVTLLAGGLLVRAGREDRPGYRYALWGLAISLVGLSVLNLTVAYESPAYGSGTGLKEAARFLRAHARPTDALVVFMWGEPPRAYWPRLAMLNYCKGQCPPQIEVVKENFIDPNPQWQQQLYLQVAPFKRVWVVTEGWPDMAYHPVEFTLVQWFYYAGTRWTGPSARLARFEQCGSRILAGNLAITEGDLQGYVVRAEADHVTGGSCLGIEIYWRYPLTTGAGKKVSLQVLDEGGRLVAQNDQFVSELVPSLTRGRLLLQRLALSLPDHLSEGTYNVVLALYDPTTMARQTFGGSDHLVLTTFTVSPSTASK